MKPFTTLTSDGKVRRLRRLLFRALEEYDITPKRVRLLNNETNAVFRVDTTDGSSYNARVLLPGGRQSIRTVQVETAWLRSLASLEGIRVPTPKANRAEEYITTASVEGVPEARSCVLFEWVPGDTLAMHQTPRSFELTGTLMARLHKHAESFCESAPAGIPVANNVFYLNDPDFLSQADTAINTDLRAVIHSAIEATNSWLRDLWSAARPHLLHGDLHRWNVSVSKDQVCAFDFAEVMWGFPIQDIGITLRRPLTSSRGKPELADAFRCGYETVQPWPARSLTDLEGAVAMRNLLIINGEIGDGAAVRRPFTSIGNQLRRFLSLVEA